MPTTTRGIFFPAETEAANGAAADMEQLATDVDGLYRQGTLAARPAAGDVLLGTFYRVTDGSGGLFVSTTTAWIDVSGGAAAALAAHEADTSNVHGITDTTALVLTDDARLTNTRTPTDNTVSTAKIVDGAVTAIKLAADAVTTDKVLDSNITPAKLSFDPATQTELNDAVALRLALAGGTLSGELNMADQTLRRPVLRDYGETLVTYNGASARDFNLETANVWRMIVAQAVTFTFSNPPASGTVGTLTIIVEQPGTLYAVTWPASVKWPGGTAPVMAINTVNVFSFITHDGGATWLGVGQVLDVR